MKRVTLSDVAREAGVSRSAAARVLLGTGGDHVRVAVPTRARIEKVSRQLDYSPNRHAQQLRGKASRTIAVILDTVNAPVMAQRLFAIEGEANLRGYRLLVGQTHGDADMLFGYVQDFRSREAEAILCLFDLVPGRDTLARKSFGKFRRVVFHGRPAWPGGYCIRVDTGEGIREAVDHLIATGKRRPAISLWNCANDELMLLRVGAFERRLRHHRLKGFMWDAASEGPEPSVAVLDRGIDYLIGKCRADAILASNDIWATRFILRLQKIGLRVPQDVAVVGFDNLDISEVVSPTLTTIDQCHGDYAREAIGLLLEIASGRRMLADSRERTIRPHLIAREST